MQTVQKRSLRQRFIGDKKFYHQTLTIVLPIIIQNTVSNVVSLLDNVMVGQVGTLQMSAVAIINQLLFVFYLCIFGGLAGPGIFSTQFFGAKDSEGVRNCFRLKMWLALIMGAVATGIFVFAPEPLIRIYLSESGDTAAEVLGYARQYLTVMIFSILPFGITSAYTMTMRESGETRLPMIASVTAIFVNLCLNWLLIFGNLGFPKLGVQGAAVATVISRYVELGIVLVAGHRNHARYPFLQGVYRTMRVPLSLIKRVAVKGAPLLVNEFLWSSGIAAILACYSMRGIEAVAACNIASTVNNLFNTVFLSMGSAVSIMVGQALGADDKEGAMDMAVKLIATTFMISIVMGAIMLLVAPAVPGIYNTEASVKDTASALLRVLAVMMPFFSISHCAYFILRSGGRTMITFFFDCVFTWVVSYACAYVTCRFTALNILQVYICVNALDLLKDVIGIILVKKGIWIRNIVQEWE